MSSPHPCKKATVSAARRALFQEWESPRGTREICAARIERPLWWNSSPRRVAPTALIEGEVDHRSLRAQGPESALEALVCARDWKTMSAPRPSAPCRQRSLIKRQAARRRRRPPRVPRRHGGQPRRSRRRRQPPLGAGRRAKSAVRSPTMPAPVTTRSGRRCRRRARAASRPGVGVGVQDPVRADRAHLRDEDAEEGVEIVRRTTKQLAGGISDVARLVAEGAGDQAPGANGGCRGGDDLGHLHVAHESGSGIGRRARRRRRRRAVIPSGAEIGIGALEEVSSVPADRPE